MRTYVTVCDATQTSSRTVCCAKYFKKITIVLLHTDKTSVRNVCGATHITVSQSLQCQIISKSEFAAPCNHKTRVWGATPIRNDRMRHNTHQKVRVCNPRAAVSHSTHKTAISRTLSLLRHPKKKKKKKKKKRWKSVACRATQTLQRVYHRSKNKISNH